MKLSIIGLNHKTAPIDVREKFYLNQLQQDLFLSELRSDPSVLEAFILSTCNRVEIYVHCLKANPNLDDFVQIISRIKKIPAAADFRKYFYTYQGQQALEHLLKVAAGLDSLIVGEKQILGQVRNAFERARERGLLAKHFNILSNITLRTGKKAQTETDISLGGSSVSWAAITMAEKILGPLTDKSVLVIGAGEMSKLTIGQIAYKGLKKLFLMNRTQAHAQELAQKFNGIPVGFCDIKEVLSQVDLCLCAVDAPHYILDLETVARIKPMNPGPKILLIDISMPRNIDPRVGELDFVTLLFIDDLDKAIEENMKKRLKAIADVEKIIADKLNSFYDKLNKIDEINPLVTAESVEVLDKL